MRTKELILGMALVLVGTAACFADSEKSQAAETQASKTQAVEQANAQFYASLNALFTGDAAPMDKIWSHADDVTYMGPAGGFQVGWQQVRANWKAQAARKLGGKVEPAETRVIVGDELAFSVCYERGDNLDAQGRPLKVSIRATNVFRKENGQWKLIGHHTDLLPFLQKQSLTKSVD